MKSEAKFNINPPNSGLLSVNQKKPQQDYIKEVSSTKPITISLPLSTKNRSTKSMDFRENDYVNAINTPGSKSNQPAQMFTSLPSNKEIEIPVVEKLSKRQIEREAKAEELLKLIGSVEMKTHKYLKTDKSKIFTPFKTRTEGLRWPRKEDELARDSNPDIGRNLEITINSTLWFPKDVIDNRAKSDKIFTSFNNIISSQDFNKSFSNSENDKKKFIFDQLRHNEAQKNIFLNTMNSFQKEFYGEATEGHNAFRKKYQALPQIKVSKHKKFQKLFKAELKNPDKPPIDNHRIQFEEEEDEDPFISQKKDARFFWRTINVNGFKPSIREGATLTRVNKQLYLIGGMGNDLIDKICRLDIEKWTWETLKEKDKTENVMEHRFGHTATKYKNKLFFFGGQKKFNKTMKLRECFNDTWSFSVDTNEWKYLRTHGDILDTRRNHTATRIGKDLFVYGGVNNYERYLSGFHSLDMNTLKWQNCDVEDTEDEGVAFHTMQAVFKSKIDYLSYYRSYEHKSDSNLRKVKEEGIYIFGGKNKKGEALGTLRLLKLGTRPLKLIKLQTNGVSPLARYSHTMDYFKQKNLLIIYGGRNDQLTGQMIFNDISVLNLINLNWIGVSLYGDERPGKCFHTSLLLEKDERLLVFGGYNTESFANPNLYCLELSKDSTNCYQIFVKLPFLDSNTAYKQFKEEQQLKKNKLAQLALSPLTPGNLPEIQTPLLPNRKSISTEFNQDFNNFKKLVSYLPLPEKSLQFRGRELWSKSKTMIKSVGKFNSTKIGRSLSTLPFVNKDLEIHIPLVD